MTAYVRKFLAIVLTLLAAVGVINFVIDPFMYFRKPSLYEAQILGPQRFVHPGIAKNFTYDTLITGSSMTENFSASLASRFFGGETVKIPIQGSAPREQLLLVETALVHAKPKRIIWGIDQDGWLFPMSTPLNPESFPAYLYRSNYLAVISNYLLSIDTLKLSASVIVAVLRREPLAKIDFDRYARWNEEFQFGCAVMRKLVRQVDDAPLAEAELAKLRPIVHENLGALESLVRDFPGTRFYFFITPYSGLDQWLMSRSDKAKWEARRLLRRGIREVAGRHANARFYDFQSDKDITLDLKRYKDLAHHSADVNDLMLEYMAKHERLESVDSYYETVGSFMAIDLFKQCNDY